MMIDTLGDAGRTPVLGPGFRASTSLTTPVTQRKNHHASLTLRIRRNRWMTMSRWFHRKEP